MIRRTLRNTSNEIYLHVFVVNSNTEDEEILIKFTRGSRVTALPESRNENYRRAFSASLTDLTHDPLYLSKNLFEVISTIDERVSAFHHDCLSEGLSQFGAQCIRIGMELALKNPSRASQQIPEHVLNQKGGQSTKGIKRSRKK